MSPAPAHDLAGIITAAIDTAIGWHERGAPSVEGPHRRLLALEGLDDLLAAGRGQIADARALVIAEAAAASSSTRQTAEALGLSVAAVAKAVARARARATAAPPRTCRVCGSWAEVDLCVSCAVDRLEADAGGST